VYLLEDKNKMVKIWGIAYNNNKKKKKKKEK
jgi:hypothetical protein